MAVVDCVGGYQTSSRKRGSERLGDEVGQERRRKATLVFMRVQLYTFGKLFIHTQQLV